MHSRTIACNRSTSSFVRDRSMERYVMRKQLLRRLVLGCMNSSNSCTCAGVDDCAVDQIEFGVRNTTCSKFSHEASGKRVQKSASSCEYLWQSAIRKRGSVVHISHHAIIYTLPHCYSSPLFHDIVPLPPYLRQCLGQVRRGRCCEIPRLGAKRLRPCSKVGTCCTA